MRGFCVAKSVAIAEYGEPGLGVIHKNPFEHAPMVPTASPQNGKVPIAPTDTVCCESSNCVRASPGTKVLSKPGPGPATYMFGPIAVNRMLVFDRSTVPAANCSK